VLREGLQNEEWGTSKSPPEQEEKMSQQLYQFNGEVVMVNSLKVTDRVISKLDDTGVLFNVRVQIELTLEEQQLAKLPFSNALVALVEAGKRKVGDGPNTVKLDIKRKFTRSWCKFAAGSDIELKDTAIALTPNVKVVEGVPTLRFWVETSVDQSVLVELVTLVKAEGVKLHTDSIQGDLLNMLNDETEKKPPKTETTKTTRAKSAAKKSPTKTTKAKTEKVVDFGKAKAAKK
jgi:hypothetical protein